MPRYLGLAHVALAPFDSRAYPPLLEYGFFWSPTKIFEYMACGIAVATTDQDYLKQVVEAEGAGVCLPQNDAKAIAEGLVRLLEDPEERGRLGRAGRRAAVESYSWQAHVRRLATILQRLGEGRQRQCRPETS
jgi:glycosyltransferase involved in cell wall biosynthesis